MEGPVAVRPTPKVRMIVLERDGFSCVRCWCRAEDIHHRHPAGMGGSTEPWVHLPANLICLCRRCHRWCETKERALAIRRGYILEMGMDPLKRAVYLPLAGPVLLDNEGGMTRVGDMSVTLPF